MIATVSRFCQAVGIAAWFFLFVHGPVLAGGGTTAGPPPFSLVRADEDYSSLREPSARKNREDAFKFIPLTASGAVYLSLGGELRERIDVFSAPNFGIGAGDDTYDLQRILFHADLHFGPRVRSFFQLGLHNAFGKERPVGPLDRGHLDLQSVFFDFTLDPGEHLTLRVGRQEMFFSPMQRFVSVREGPNIRQSFDGIRAMWRSDGFKFDMFAVRPVALKPGTFDDASDRTQAFWGTNIEKTFSPVAVVSIYAFELDRDHVRYGAISGNERRTSVGARLAGNQGEWDYDFEAIAQFGHIAAHEIRAWGGSADAGYTLTMGWMPRLGFRIDAGSGGRNSTGTIGTFQPLFPKGAYFNESALTSWSNILALRPSVKVQPTKSLTIEISILARWRENSADAVYLQPSIPIAATLSNRARTVGQAYGFDAVWKMTRNLTLITEVDHQVAGPAIIRARGHDSDFAMMIAQFRF